MSFVALLAAAVLVSGEGAGILGTPAPDWGALRWVQGGPLRLAELRGKVVLVRFFMDSACPYCRGTAPALNELDREFGPLGLVVVGLYTPKPRPRPTTVEEVRRYVEAYAFRFPVAVDDDWAALKRLWLNRVPGASYTSASLLVDRRGIVRHVHPGGLYAKDSSDEQARRDYAALHEAIVRLLAEPQK